MCRRASGEHESMIDLHTHMLPDWDDGARSWEETKAMAQVAAADGIRKIALTPHIFRLTKHNDDWSVLEERKAEFKRNCMSLPCEFSFGAEVFVHHEMVENIRNHHLTINGSDYFFIEFPAETVLPGVKDLIFNIMLRGCIPIISHPERNSVFSYRPGLLYELVKMGCLAQVTAKSIIGEMGQEAKRAADIFLKHNLVHIIASDAHDPVNRPPRLSQGVREAVRIVGKEKAEAMVTSIPEAILQNAEIGDWGEPLDPVREKKWTIKLPSFIKKT
ncbi:MAG: hypothetical protein NTV82_19405 [Candidatus Aminicenantes bacterium]|nr:hypothetical protein [Candidatus Aminicenantes bacterium]